MGVIKEQKIDSVVFTGREYANHKAHWEKVLLEIDRPFAFPNEKVDMSGHRKPSDDETFVLTFSEGTSALIHKITAGKPLNVSVIMLAAYHYILAKYTGSGQSTLVTPPLSQNSSGNEITASDLVLLHLPLPDEGSIKGFIDTAKDRIAKSYQYQGYPLGLIEDGIHLPSKTNVAFSNASVHVAWPKDVSFDLGVSVEEHNNSFSLSVRYNKDIFQPDFIADFARNLEKVVLGFQHIDNPITTLSYLSDEQYVQIIEGFNDGKKEYTDHASLIEAFKHHADSSPSHTAISYKGKHHSYEQVAQKANQLAAYLRNDLGIGVNDRIGLISERSDKAIISFLATMQLGATYVPIDLSFSKEQVGQVLKESGLSVLLIDSSQMFRISDFDKPVFVLDYQLDTLEETDDYVHEVPDDQSTAYIIFTSGSTGGRKGVQVSYRSLHNLCFWYQEQYQIGAGSKVLLIVPLGFDASVKNIIVPLMSGGTLVLPAADDYNPQSLAELIHTEGVTHLNCVPSAFMGALYFAESEDYSKFITLKWLAFGGEPLDLKPFQKWQKSQNCNATITNVYGPTEAVDSDTFYEVKETDTHAPIGRPIPNVEVYVLDEVGLPVPVGILGEIHVGGMGVAKGYLNKEELTQEKFVPNNFSTEQGAMMYRTGDMAKWNTEGQLEFFGRIDEQVKINGIRIEPAEVEAVLRKHPGIEEAHILVEKLDQDSRLNAALTAGRELAYTVNAIQKIQKADPNILDKLYMLPNGMQITHMNKTETDFIYDEVFQSHAYIRHGITIAEGDVIFDVGGNIGMFSLYAGLHYKGVQVYSFEPMTPVYEVLSTNVSLYDVNVTPYNIGLSKEEGEVEFTYYQNNTALSGRYGEENEDKEILRKTMFNQSDQSNLALSDGEIEDILTERIHGQKVTCKIRRLSDIIKENNITHIDYLKVDVERSELDVLLGIDEEDWPKIKQVVLEVHDIDDHITQIEAMLNKYGFEYRMEEEDVLKGSGLYNIYATKVPGQLDAERALPEIVQFNKEGGKWTSINALIKSIKQHIEENLPEYMVPAGFKLIEEFPVTVNGKVDKKALLKMPGLEIQQDEEYIAPEGEVEEKLLKIWQDILNKDVISMNDDFFKVGGNSLKVVQLINRVHKAFQVKFEFKTIFEMLTIRELAVGTASAQKQSYQTIEPIGTQDYYEVSHAQRRLWILDQFEEAQVSYNMPAVYPLSGVDSEALEKAMEMIVRRHESLRTVFVTIDGEPKQKINTFEECGIRFEHIDLSLSPSSEEEAQKLIGVEINTPFDLSKGPLFRIKLIHLGDDNFLLLSNMHHIISDGWSQEVLQKEVLTLYQACVEGQADPLPGLSIQYKDYAAWQNQNLLTGQMNASFEYWSNELKGTLPLLQLPTDYPRPALKTFRGSSMDLILDKGINDGLNQLNQTNGTTMFMMLRTLVSTLLYKYTDQDDIIIGSAVAGRNHENTEDQIGFYINNLALRTQIDGEESFEGLLSRVKDNTLSAYEHQDYPFDKLVDDLDLPRDLSRSPVFDVFMVLQNVKEKGVLGDLEQREEMKTSYLDEYVVSKFDITFGFAEFEDGLLMTVEYNTDLFSQDRISRLLEHFRQLTSCMLADPGVKVAQMECMSEAEKDAMITANTQRNNIAYPDQKTIHQLFEESVSKYPDAIAVVSGDHQVSYTELNEKANQLAHYLIGHHSLQPNDTVGLVIDRSEWALISILGVLKAGAAYVPIDPAYPQERIDYMLTDTGAGLVMTSGTVTINDIDGRKEINIEALWDEIRPYPTENPGSISTAKDLAYVIYTSGSTGKPKGVMVEHHNVVRLLFNEEPQFTFSSDDVWTLFHSMSFDFSVWEMWGALLYGGRLVVISEEDAKNPAEVVRILQEEQVSVLNQTPSYFLHIAHEALSEEMSPSLSLRYVIFGGEALHPASLQDWHQSYPQVKLINMYGITETTVHVTYKEIGAPEIKAGHSNIGRPLPASSVYIMDGHHQLKPQGTIGELVIGGEGVARGYLNNEELTTKKFIDNPYAPGERLYCSGDLGMLMPNGEIQYMGRRDEQVKIRGYRIELGEVENTLSSYHGVKEGVVMAHKGDAGDDQLVAYLSLTDVGEHTVEMLKDHLGHSLPEYMIPSHFIVLDRLPLTPNGKVDRKQLPDIQDSSELRSGVTYVAPGSGLERQLAKLWEEVLDKKEISLLDNFFAIGGHSIKAVQLISRVNKEMKVKLELRDVFSNPTLEGMSKVIAKADKNPFEEIHPIAEQEYYELSYNQNRILMDHYAGGHAGYNVNGNFRFEGPLDTEALEKALQTIVQRHEVLRTVFITVEGEPRQKILAGDTPFGIEYMDMTEEREKEAAIEALVKQENRKVFDLEKGPLLRFRLIQLGKDEHLFSFTVHHILADGWSMSVLINEVLELYNCYHQGKSNPYKPLTIQYKDYAAWHNEQLSGENLASHRNYWKQQFRDKIPVLQLATDFERSVKDNNGGSVKLMMDASLKEGLKAMSVEKGTGLFTTLLACYKALLYRYTHQDDLVVGTVEAGRNHIDLEGQIGFYINTMALRTQFKASDSFEELLDKVNEVVLGAHRHRTYPLDMLMDDLGLESDRSRSPLFDVIFALQNGQVGQDEPISMEGLEVSNYDNDEVECSHDLIIELFEQPQGMLIKVMYDANLFKPETVTLMMERFIRLAEKVVENPALKLGDIPLTEEAGQSQGNEVEQAFDYDFNFNKND